MSKFAPITANLLARKGDAMPSALPKQSYDWSARHDAPPPPPIVARTQPAIEHFVPQPRPVVERAPDYRTQPAPPPPPHHEADKPRRLFVALSHEEYERLAIAAVKKNINQHQIVHDALAAYFEAFGADSHCQCVGGSCSRGCGTN